MAHLAAGVKTRWNIEPAPLLRSAEACATHAQAVIASARELRSLPADADALLLKNSICPKPLHKALVLAETIDEAMEGGAKQAARVALASTLVQSASNLHFGPEVGVKG